MTTRTDMPEMKTEEMEARTFHVRAVTLLRTLGGSSQHPLSFDNITTIMRHVRLC